MSKPFLWWMRDLWNDVIQARNNALHIKFGVNTIIESLERGFNVEKRQLRKMFEGIRHTRWWFTRTRRHAREAVFPPLVYLIDRLSPRLQDIEARARTIQRRLKEKPQNREAIKKDAEAIVNTVDEIIKELEEAANNIEETIKTVTGQWGRFLPAERK